VIGHPFALFLPASVEEAVELAGRYGSDARALAGGTVLVPEMSRGAARPGVVIDLSRCGLAGVLPGGFGALTTYRELAALPGLLGRVARGITGGAQIRNRATAGGSACYANPASDVPAALVALEATLVLASAGGERRLPAPAFFVDAFVTAARPGELLVSIELPPLAPGSRFGYEKLRFGESSWPIVTAAAIVRPGGGLRVVLGGAAAVPVAVEVGAAAELEEAIRAALVEPWSDVLAGSDYRRRVAPVMARRALGAA
jgi:carbon-monoxide dehydrogenase medium subunit